MKVFIRNRVREYRKKAGFSQTQLGLLVGISKNSVSSIERGVFEPRLSVALRLSLVLDCPVDTLFYYDFD